MNRVPATASRAERLYNSLNAAYCGAVKREETKLATRIDNAMRWLESFSYVQWGVEF